MRTKLRIINLEKGLTDMRLKPARRKLSIETANTSPTICTPFRI